MTESQKINDVLPPEDGWGAVIFPLPEWKPLPPGTMERLFGHLPTVEITLEGTWNDMEAP